MQTNYNECNPKPRHIQVGFTIRISDHMGKFNPLAFKDVNHLILLAAGTGFTPMAKLTTSFLRLVPLG